MNEYKPWVEMGITEVDYWRKRYLEARIETGAFRETLALIAEGEGNDESVYIKMAVQVLDRFST